MNLTPYTTPATIKAIYDHYVAKRKNEHRPHLGGSQIGNECDRALWYQFRWAWSPEFEGRQLRLFETGDREEDRIVSNLRAVGVTVWDRDPDTGKQIRFTACDGHFALSLDGVGEGFSESSKPHTLEFKTMNEKNFAALKAKGVKETKPVYWAQCQIGMHHAQIDRCVFLAVNKNTDELYMERIKYDAAEALMLAVKAERIVFAFTPPSRLSEDPSFFKCRFCSYKPICHGCKIPEVNCRTCAHATPERGGDGAWSCAKGLDMKPNCSAHLFIPQMMPPDLEVHDTGADWVEYLDKDTGEIVRNQNNSSALYKGRMVP
jgi:hypothetical protein